MPTTSMSGSLAAAPSLSSTKPAASILSLPAETQREIVAHCSQSDLICLALVSRRFHELASAQLYRNFHIIFPDEDDIHFDSPIDGLAGGLNTFTTSEYNYARHLRDLSMDTLSLGRKGEQSYQPYLYKASCGKFLNTLLHLTLKRARSLESFRWNIRIELSRPVYAQLHEITTLKRVHIRLQAGDSYYAPPPPLPAATDSHTDSPTSQPAGNWPSANEPTPLYGHSMSSSSIVSNSSSPPLGPPPSLLPHSSRPRPKGRTGNNGTRNVHPPTLSGFKDLSSLSVLDIDNLDIVEELQTCVKRSFSTLKTLQLSLSSSLAQRARKSPHDSDVEDSDLEDEPQEDPQSNNAIDYNGTGPIKAFRAQEERKLQEAILAKIFDIEEHQLLKKSSLNLVGGSLKFDGNGNQEATPTGSEGRADDPRREFVDAIRLATTRFMFSLNGSRPFSISQQEALELIERAARKYVDSEPQLAEAKCDVDNTTPIEGQAPFTSSLPDERVENDESSMHRNEDGGCLVEEDMFGGASSPRLLSSDRLDKKLPTENAGLLPSRTWSQLSPEDIDIEHLEIVKDHFDVFHDQQFSADVAMDCGSATTTPLTIQNHGSNQATTNFCSDCADHDDDDDAGDDDDAVVGEEKMEESSATAPSPQDRKSEFGIVKVDRDAITKKLVQLHRLVRGVGRRVLEIREERLSGSRFFFDSTIDSELALLNRSAVEVANEIRILEAEIEELVAKPTERSTRDSATKQSIEAYKRNTRGMSIESLKICLIPVKASVLSRAIDVACIKELTLLNVGNQAPIWSMLIKEQKNRPLALRSVYTDHVSVSFLTCMAQLPILEELFMLERGLKYRPESFAPRSATSIDQIRRLVLKKHMHTLKRLMIKDEYQSPTWDANEKTIILICTRGVQLEELALSMNIHAVHAFMQYFSGLVNLRAINILHFKNNDTCIWVMRELFRFIVDNLSHHPQLKLEWIATEDNHVDRVIRPCETSPESSPSCLSSSQAPVTRDEDKGKDKAHAVSSNVASAQYPILSADAIEADSESDDDDDDKSDCGWRLRYKVIGPMQFYDVWGVKIFEKEIRKGSL
ncbi:hypothetical protein E4U55_004419 [Claviceps digitariae]|nr:hypothetical protein E4U55_004419 [Claviceps digitariae]